MAVREVCDAGDEPAPDAWEPKPGQIWRRMWRYRRPDEGEIVRGVDRAPLSARIAPRSLQSHPWGAFSASVRPRRTRGGRQWPPGAEQEVAGNSRPAPKKRSPSNYRPAPNTGSQAMAVWPPNEGFQAMTARRRTRVRRQ